MALTNIKFSPPEIRLPASVEAYLDSMTSFVEQYHSQTVGGFRGFVPCDYVGFYRAVAHIVDRRLSCGNTFCEWGSGLGIATCLASMLGFDAAGIEIDERLFRVAERVAQEMALPVRFVHGSCLPPGVDDLVDDAYAENDGLISMIAHADDAYAELGRDLSDFDFVFAFPWPNDEELTTVIFERFACDGALLLTYDEVAAYRLRRK